MSHRRGVGGPLLVLGVLLIAGSCKDKTDTPAGGAAQPGAATTPAPTAPAGGHDQPGTGMDTYVSAADVRKNHVDYGHLTDYVRQYTRYRDTHESDHWYCDRADKSCAEEKDFVNIRIAATVDAKDLGPDQFAQHGYIMARLKVVGRENIPKPGPGIDKDYIAWYNLTKDGDELYWWVGPDTLGPPTDKQKRSSYMLVIDHTRKTVTSVPMSWAYWEHVVLPNGLVQHGPIPGNRIPVDAHPAGAMLTRVNFTGAVSKAEGGDTGPWVRCGGGCCVGPPR